MLLHFRSGFCCRQRTVRLRRARASSRIQLGSRLLEGDVDHPVALFAHEADAENIPSDHRPRSIKQREEGIRSSTRTESLDAIAQYY